MAERSDAWLAGTTLGRVAEEWTQEGRRILVHVAGAVKPFEAEEAQTDGFVVRLGNRREGITAVVAKNSIVSVSLAD